LVVNSLDLDILGKAFWLGLSVATMGFPPILVYLYEIKSGKIKDWFMTNKKERRDVQIAWFLGAVLFTAFAWIMTAPEVLLVLALILLVLSLIFTTINFFWKISVHMMGVTLFTMMATLVYSVNFIWLFLLVFLVGWARIKLGAHSTLQVFIGAIVTVKITFVIFNLFFPGFG
jgi:membrane-associated phospholipid phosphatase